ncbi:MAG: hypothetical protein ACKOD9_06265 [Rubrivivax sp.]
MNRCDRVKPRSRAHLIVSEPRVAEGARRSTLVALTCGLFLGTAIQAQPGPPAGHRSFPAHALRGELLVGAMPAALLNGQAARLAPGARIRGEDNLLRLPGSLIGQPVIVHFTQEPSTGMLMDVWILNRAELSNTPWPASPAEAATWRFDPLSQRWTRP